MTIMTRALTLLETLLALVLLLALGAIVVPSIVRGLEERTFEQAADVTSEQLMLARAHALTTGEPVEVTFRAETSKVEARLFSAASPLSEFDAIGIVSAAPVSVARPRVNKPSRREAPEASREIAESWATRPLAKGVRIVSQLPHQPDSAAADQGASPNDTADDQTIEEMVKGQDVRLAVFLPDGSALASGPVWLGDEAGRWGKLTVNPWSGMPMFRRVASLTETQESETRAEPEARARGGDEARHPAAATAVDPDMEDPREPALEPESGSDSDSESDDSPPP